MAQVYLVTGASTGFGYLPARALARAGHTVFAGMYRPDGNTSSHEADVRAYAQEYSVDLRPVALDLLSQDSIEAAVTHIRKKHPPTSY
jgi:NAD(P)-dependent dehydrogenase (short-subunit alcohol dehydrogenase family)